ncbi:hypothetical protein TraAM80_06905 [Trypanosoma rangeli]|uniref:Uncharacterized protein n=1 Tax=Trypanosoma rangeli TaxID=5698 RepID=A0A3R7LR32_TRYRA|nr:uncharacterized protein TraAM80_06905 [Trypanosoma rangeli]RNF01721.1 hypothetical protein TraAM80_06905 [Trypanosoma rangeli]|eukprot:RNF01721.1 hypothetical protein TraAM80_06905 [Trypanosoma rangeli]
MRSKKLHSTLLLVTLLTCASVVGGVRVPFPPSFFVTTGTTIPFLFSAPVAQSGAIYVSNRTRQLRIDNFFLGSQYSFIVDGARRRGYLLENYAPGSYGASREGKGSFCRTFKMTGDVASFGVPDEFLKHTEPSLVRGVEVLRYTGYDRDSTGPLQQVDYYVRNMSFKLPGERKGSVEEFVFSIPWRVQTRRQQQALKELTDAPITVPNWRYFGGPFFDELVMPDEPYYTHLQRLMEDTVVTVDFYNFVPIAPDPSVFIVPSDCEKTDAEAEGSNVDISLAHRLLVDLTFYSKAGREALQDKLP